MTIASQGLDPVLADHVVAKLGCVKPTAQLNGPLVQKTPQPQRGCLLDA
jgi:hypothetical protein